MRMALNIHVTCHDVRWERHPEQMQVLRKVVRCVASDKGISHKSVSVLLTNDAEMHQLNQQYRGIDRPTNVLSFCPSDDFPDFLGDIALSYERVHTEPHCADSGADLFAHLVTHALLHLLGYDHECDEDAVVMESEERRILKKMGFCAPLHNTW